MNEQEHHRIMQISKIRFLKAHAGVAFNSLYRYLAHSDCAVVKS